MLLKERLETMTSAERAQVEQLWPELFDNSYVRRHVYMKGQNDVYEIDRFRDFNPDLIYWIDATNLDQLWNEQSLIPLDNAIPYDGKMYWIQGKCWTDEWDNICFKPKINREAKHYLIKVEWGGPNSKTRGVEWDTLAPMAKHYKRCVSRNGKQGINYYILPTKFQFHCETSVDQFIRKLKEKESEEEL